uniref:Ycf1 protein n=1 Tax=Ceriops zippeliana TaxID=413951 RepID=UPI001F13F202|nr:Ycf1 protein [Ceriops zippeliana]UMI33635.1 Ycf1 protein [Ceriops zippeliana]
MILKSFILGNLVSLCMKIINSVVVVGLYYGFLTTFSMGPSYLFLLRARVIEEGEEGTEKKVSATTGFITGQLMMFISIYYAPLHLALGRPHTITVLALPYFLFHFFWNNHKHFFDYESTTRNSMRNLSIQCVFLNNLIFQLFNHFILPSSMLVRLVNIYMFRCNNKMLFVTSSFVGWLIGHILFMKWVGLILVWIQQNNSIRSNVLIRSNKYKYLVSELRNSMARIFSILLFITCVYSLGRIPSPIFTKKLKETSETEEREEETDVEIETTSETKGTKQEPEGSTEEDPASSLFSEEKEDPDKIDETEKIRVNGKEKTKDEFHFHFFKETYYKNRPVYETFYLDGNQENSKLEILIDKKDKDLFWFEKPLVTIFFDSKSWNRPFRYIKKNQFENAVKKEMSQYFFYTCQSDGKERISFTYPPSLSTFLEMIQRKISLVTTEKTDKLSFSNHWNFFYFNNKQKKKKISNEFLNRVKTIFDKGFFPLNILEKRIRLCNNKTKNKKEYLSKIYDPLLSGSLRGRTKLFFSPSIINEIFKKNCIEMGWINKIHLVFLITNYQEFEPKMGTFNIKLFSTEIGYFLNLINEFSGKSTLSFNFHEFYLLSDHKEKKMYSENRIKILKFLFDAIIAIADPHNKRIRKKSIGIKEISKKIPRWSYKLIGDLEQPERDSETNVAVNPEIRSRKSKRVVIFTDNNKKINTYNNNKDATNSYQTDEINLIRYSQQSDFRRDIIKGSMRAQRRKTAIWELFQANARSLLFLGRIDKSRFFDLDISELMKILFINWMCKKPEFMIVDSTDTEEKPKESEKNEEDKREKDKRKEKTRMDIAEAWDSILFAQVIRGCILLTQSIIRKYILLPSVIIVKNIIRMLLFQFPEWSEDLMDWNREIHVKCTYNGVQLSETEFPKSWLTDGIQIKILFPFRLKPWHRPKLNFPHKDRMQKKGQTFCFLTIWGMETELPFGFPRKKLSVFEPIFKKLGKKIIKFQKNFFLVIKISQERSKERITFFLNLSKERKNWVIKKMLFLKEIINKLSKSKKNSILLFRFREVYELNETKKDLIINNQTIHKNKNSPPICPMDWTNFLLTEKKMKDLTARTSTIRNEIEKIRKEKKNRFLTSEINIGPTKITYNAKKVKSSKKISQILKRRNTRFLRKFNFFIKMLIEKIYIDILLGIINIPKIHHVQPFLESTIESTRRIINKYIYNNKYNNKENYKRIEKTNQNTNRLISIIKKLLNICVINKDSRILVDVSSLSQTYVFYKLSQIQVINLYKLRSALQYHRASLFVKNEIKKDFEAQGLFHSDLKDNNFRNSVMNQWKSWLKNYYQYKYNLSQIKWSRLIPQKWRNRINQRCIVQDKDLNKWNLYEKDQLIHYEKENDFEGDSLPSQKKNFKKHYRYNLLLYKSINDENKKDSYIYGSPLQINNKHEISYNYKTPKRNFLDMFGDIPILNNYLAEEDSINMEKPPDRKNFDWKNFKFCIRKKGDIESWIDTGTKQKNNIKTRTHKYQIIDKIDNKDIFSLTIQQDHEGNSANKKKNLFDWMEMNEEILNQPISNLELWFFPKFVIFCHTYEIKPWVIPIKLLLVTFNDNEKINENKKTNRKKNDHFFISLFSNKKKSIELENRNHEEKEFEDPMDLGSVLSNQEKDIEEDYAESNLKKRIKQKQYKRNTQIELYSFLKKHLGFQLRWDAFLNQKIINNIKLFCLLLRVMNPREIIISSIQRGEMSLAILMIQKDFTLTKLMKKGILIIEPMGLSVKIKNNGHFIIYQTVSILLIHKSKQQINERYRKKSYKNKFTEFIERHQSITVNKEKNDYDLLVPENFLSPKRRRELRIQFSFNSKNINDIHINTKIFNGNNIKNCKPILYRSKYFDKDKNKLLKFKPFLWPIYRLEDLACINRYWFDTHNASRFSMLRIHLYPQLKIR